jgi:hypothetical protein
MLFFLFTQIYDFLGRKRHKIIVVYEKSALNQAGSERIFLSLCLQKKPCKAAAACWFLGSKFNV